jgi:trehalose 6-phosphate phosphatase
MPEAGLGPDRDDRAGMGSAWALFLDFDGTLVDIAERPEAVVVKPGLADALASIRDRVGGALAVVTGRPIAAIDAFLAPHRFDAAGVHGVEHRLAGSLSSCRADGHPDLRRTVAALHDWFRSEPAVLIEDKDCSVAVHWRMAPHLGDVVSRVVTEAAAALGPGYRLQRGKAVIEILPAYAAKSRIIEEFLRHAPYRGRRPIFVGDDLTDEPAFDSVNADGGVSVRVGPGPTRASRRLPDPAAMRDLLWRWSAGAEISFDELAPV